MPQSLLKMPYRLCALVLLLLVTCSVAYANDPFNPSPTAATEFLPVEEAYQLQIAVLNGHPILHWDIAEGYYLYRHRFDFKLIGHPEWQHQVQLPAGKHKDDPYFGPVETYYHNLDIELAAVPATAVLAVTSQGCADAGLCYPPQTEYFQIDPVAGTAERSSTPPPHTDSRPGAKSLFGMLALAAVGGLILNLMPCVFPVLSLKVMAFAGDKRHNTTLHGLIYSTGVIASFVAIAALLIGLTYAGRAVGWGFQLQSPWFVGALAYLFLVLALSLSGFWELGGSWMGLGQNMTRGNGYGSSFFTGVLAVLVASPCTAPFMGSALGYAVTQPPFTALLVFAALGAGMALPVLLLCAFPQWLKHLPKPGAWMERLKQILAYPLYATAIWLLWVAGRQAGVNAMAALLGGGLLVALALWLWRFGLAARSVAAACLAVSMAVLASPLLQQNQRLDTDEQAADWQPYSDQRLTRERAAGRPVFVNVTADWCLTCLANEQVALSSDSVRQAFARQGVVYLKADWTRYDPNITELLARYGRNGVPLYLYFAPGENAKILPQILTPGRVIESIRPQ